jgi:hypothetical protein
MLLKIRYKSSISINTATAIAVKNFRESLLSNISRLFFLFVVMSKFGWLLFELDKSQRRNLGIQIETARKNSERKKPRPSRTGLFSL